MITQDGMVCGLTGHVGGDGNGPEASGLGHDLTLTLHVLRAGVQYLQHTQTRQTQGR